MSYIEHKTSVLEPDFVKVKDCEDYCVQPDAKYLWKEECPPKKPWKPCDSDLCPLEIQRRYEDAVVRIFTQTPLTGYNRPPTAPFNVNLTPFSGAVGQTADNSFDTYTTYGNGFKSNNYIICPAHLVQLPPNLAQYYTSPSTQVSIVSSPNGATVWRVGRIIVDIFNVNGSGYSFTYEAELLGIDGVNDVAMLYIPPPNSNAAFPSNSGNPIIKCCHPDLSFGCSRKYRDTEPAYVLGDVVTQPNTLSINQGGVQGQGVMDFASRGILSTTVLDYKHVDYSGLAQPEMVLLDGNAYAASGCPILNKYGQVIAMQTLSTVGLVDPTGTRIVGDGKLGGVSQFSMVRSIILLDRASRGGLVPQASLITDVVSGSSFWLLGHAYLGVAWDLVTASSYGSYIDSTSGYQLPRVDLAYNFLPLPAKKEVVGVRVRALAGEQVGVPAPGVVDNVVQYIAVPGQINPLNPTTDPYFNFVSSPLIGQVFPNDIIVDINGMKIGDLHKQAALSLALWALVPGSPITLRVRVNTADEMYYNQIKTVNVRAAAMPNWVNFPWYKYPSLPVAGLFGGSNAALQSNWPSVVVDSVDAVSAPFFPSI